ncbi:MAG: lytic transglycosylase domain-containing protein [Bacillati bacterium]
MNIAHDLASIDRRIAQITGMDMAPAPAAATVLPVGAPAGPDGLPILDAADVGATRFRQLVRDALASAGGPPTSDSFASADAQTPSVPGGPAPVPPAQIDQLVAANAATWGVDPALVKAVIANESGFNANATSDVGAQGLMQLMPSTAAGLGVTDAYNPVQNVWGGTRYLRGLLDRFGGNVPFAVAAYNAGPGAVEKYGGIPPYAQTQNYVQNVLSSYEKYRRNPTQ